MLRYFVSILAFFIVSSTVIEANAGSEYPVYLYLSPHTETYLKTIGASYEDTLVRWRQYLKKKYRRNFKEIGRTELLGKLESGVLVLASAQALDIDEKNAISRFASTGGSLLATWATGLRDAHGIARGYGFIENMFNARILGQFSSEGGLFLMPFGDGPLTWGLPAGRRMAIGSAPKEVLRMHSDHLAAVYMNWIRAKDEVGPNGAIAFHESALYRGVYFSFPETVWGYHPQADMNLLLDGTLDWLRREPRVFKSAWPDGKIAAHLIEMDTEFEFFSAPTLANHLESIGAKGTFYCLTSEAIRYPEIVKNLFARGHEIAYHADIHTGFKSLAANTQEKRIQTMREQMRSILGDDVHAATGFRAPTESYDATTEALLRKYGILHHAADPSASQDRLPFFSLAESNLDANRALVVLPRTQLDDVNFKRLIYGTERIESNLAHDLDMIVMSGAFGLLSVHSQNYVEDGLMRPILARYMGKVATYKDVLWVARGDEISAWWRNREKVSITHTSQTDQLNFVMTVEGTSSVKGLTVFVTHPIMNAVPIIAAKENTSIKFLIKPIDTQRSALIFDELNSGKYAFSVKFKPSR
jgi:hypothetical protein